MPDGFWDRFVHMSYRGTATGQLEPDVDPAVAAVLRKSQGKVRLLRSLRKLGLLHRVAGVHIDPWDSFRAVTMPCLLVRGALSDVLTAEIAQAMRNVKPHMELVTVPSRGHAPLLTEPEALEAVLGFLPRVFSSEPSTPRQEQKAQG
jgi:pimeloyl-ACP methyl ester carboxylesterase